VKFFLALVLFIVIVIAVNAIWTNAKVAG